MLEPTKPGEGKIPTDPAKQEERRIKPGESPEIPAEQVDPDSPAKE